MLKELKQKVFQANLDLVNHKLVLFTWGNVSGIDREKGLIVIKPSGVSYTKMTANDMVIVDMKGRTVDSKLKPSSDTPTHLQLYKTYSEIEGIAHTHSTYATAWSQAGTNLPIIGTTHADYFASDVPCTNDMTKEEVFGEYEMETGNAIIKSFKGKNPMHIPGVLVKNHGPFTWGKSADEAVYNSVVLEEISKMAYISYTINPSLGMNKNLVNKHFERKHGKNAYYGQ